ncbi:lyase family protein [Paracoccus sp. R86501]|uniref:lyase family protein n=1 Tax=Paracoccus sp. R86501 TaxID=3101711 RepID=UPI00366DF460
MTGPADSPLYSELFGDDATAAQFTAKAELSAMIRTEGALAQVQGQAGLIPAASAAAIVAACTDMQIDPATLATATARNGVPVPALVQAMRAQIPADHAQYLHWGATSQDIMDTGLALRLCPMLDLWEDRLTEVLARLGQMAAEHADLQMGARTYGQLATPTSFGAVVAGWGWPLIEALRDMDRLRTAVLRVSLAGAAGTLSAMGDQGAQIRAGLARALDLGDPGHAWHSDRSGMATLAGWMASLAASLGKMAEDLLLMTQSGLGLVAISGGGGSSTMPQKQNPVAAAALAALSRQVLGLSSTMTGAGLHRQQRDGAAWFTEWLTLPQLCISTGRMLSLAEDLLSRLQPDAQAMQADLQTGNGVIHAEALSFALVQVIGIDRVEAAAKVKQMCQTATRDDIQLTDLAQHEWPGHDWPHLLAARGLGLAPSEARDFAQAVSSL